MALVYAAVNLKNDKMYVGATEKKLRDRKMRHLANANRGQMSKFYSALRKHGQDNFAFLTIHQCKDFFEALEFERAYISRLKPEYNMTDGGGGVKGLKFSDEAKAKMRAAKLGKPSVWSHREMPEEHKRRLIDATRKRCLGTKITDPVRLGQIREMSLKANAARRKSVVCLNTGMIFKSVTEAAKFFNTETSSIVNWCSGVKSRRGIRLQYEVSA